MKSNAGTHITAVIPARYGSTRFPGKPLARIHDRPMIQWVYEKAEAAETISQVLVATDDTRISEAVEAFGGNAVMTSTEHPTGTDRIAEAIRQNPHTDWVLNIQGDEPLIPPAVIDRLCNATLKTEAAVGTVAVPFDTASADPEDPNCVKVVRNEEGYALYFSRALIPYNRSEQAASTVSPLLHWGLYLYSTEILNTFVQWPQGALEKTEKLEQLRLLEHGCRIRVTVENTKSTGVDVPEDISRAEEILQDEGATS